MGNRRHKLKEIVANLRQVDVLRGQGFVLVFMSADGSKPTYSVDAIFMKTTGINPTIRGTSKMCHSSSSSNGTG